jgi:hypothetical protein
VRREARVVYLTVAVFLAIGGIATLRQPILQGAKGSLLASPTTFLDPAGTDALPELSDTILALGESRAVLSDAASAYTQQATDLQTRARRIAQATPAWLRSHIDLRPAGTSSVIEVSATARRAADARDLADAEMTALRGFVATARTRVAGDDRPGLRLLIVSPARPQGWVSPRPVRNAVVALLAGLIAGCAMAVVVARRRRRSVPGRVARELSVPWLGTATPAQAGAVVSRFLEGVAASERRPGHVALVTGGAPAEAIAEVAENTVGALNGRTRRGLLVDGGLAARAVKRRRKPAQVLLPAPAPRAWSEAPVPAELEPWHEFVVLNGPRARRLREVLPLAGAVHSVVLLVDGSLSPEDFGALRQLAREAEDVRVVVGVIGVDHANSSP